MNICKIMIPLAKNGGLSSTRKRLQSLIRAGEIASLGSSKVEAARDILIEGLELSDICPSEYLTFSEMDEQIQKQTELRNRILSKFDESESYLICEPDTNSNNLADTVECLRDSFAEVLVLAHDGQSWHVESEVDDDEQA
jgi:hypothetical protein